MVFGSGPSISNISLKTMPRMSWEMETKIEEYISKGDITGIQSLLTAGKISIYTEDLFAQAAFNVYKSSSDATDILLFLIHQGCQLNISAPQMILALFYLYPRMNQTDGLFQIFKLVCSKVEYAEEPVDELCKALQQLSGDADVVLESLEILDWLAFTGAQITTLPSEFYLGSALSFMFKLWARPLGIERLKTHRELARKLVTAGADLHYRNQYGDTLLQHLLSSSPLQMHDDLIPEWLQLLAGCGIDVENYALQEIHFSDGEPFELETWSTITLTNRKIFLPASPYTCIRIRALKFTFDDTGYLNPKILRWVDPESPAALVLEEFDFCQDLISICGHNCEDFRQWAPLWERSPQDLRDIPIAALYMLAEMGWDFQKHWAGISILPADQDAIWLIDEDSDGFPEEFLQRLNTMPEIRVSTDPKQVQRGLGRLSESIDPTEIFIGTSVAKDTELRRAFKISYGTFCREVSFCHCDIFDKYLDLWPFHGSTHTLCRTGNKLDEPCLGSIDPWWCEVHKCRFNHARFERKQAKRIAKRRKREGNKLVTCSMPGSWPG